MMLRQRDHADPVLIEISQPTRAHVYQAICATLNLQLSVKGSAWRPWHSDRGRTCDRPFLKM